LWAGKEQYAGKHPKYDGGHIGINQPSINIQFNRSS